MTLPLPAERSAPQSRRVIAPAATTSRIQHDSIARAGRARIAAIVALLASTAIAACAPAAASALGDSPARARANTRDFFNALSARLGPLSRSDRLKQIRPRYVRGSLVPSRVFNDTVVWTSSAGLTRTVVIAGGPTSDHRYTLDVAPDAATPLRVGDSRHIMHLRSLGKSAYEWRSVDELAVGAAPPAGLDLMRRRLLGSAEGRSGAELRLLWQRALPRTTAALGRLFAVDSVTTVVLPDRSTMVALRVSIDPKRLTPELSDFAAWAGKYIGNSRYRMVLEDGAGTPYGLFSVTDRVLRIRLRTRDGVMQPLAGAAPVPSADSLRLRVDVSTKGKLFAVGARNLLVDLVPVATATERGWTIHYRREPDWNFPFAIEHLMRDALRRPFSGEGTSMRIVARREPNGQTLIARDFRMEVEESAIVRWISSLGNSAMSEVTARVEQQKDRFVADALAALGADLADQIGETDVGTGDTR